MDHKNETNRLSEHKKRKKKKIFYNRQNNQVTSKIIDNKKKISNNYLRIDPSTSSNKNEIISMSNSPTDCIETLHKDTKHFFKSESYDLIQELHSDLNSPLCPESNNSFKIDASSVNKEVPDSSLKNDNKGTISKYKNPISFIQCEHGDYFCCRLCHKSQLLIDNHRKLNESKLNYLRKFHCAMCDKGMRSLIDWKTHSTSLSHIDKIMNNTDYVSYDCGGCKAVFFETQEKILKHCRTAHNDSSGLPYVFKCMKEVFRHFLTTDPDKWKTWTFCGPCKKYSSIKFHCFTLNHVGKKTMHFNCKSCLINFICNQDVYDKHLISCEHIMLEYLRNNKAMSIFNIKLPPVILSRFTIENDKTTCNECKFQMFSNDKAIASHMAECIITPDLGGKNKIKIFKYFCAVCNETVSDFNQWKFHLIFPSHLIKCHDYTDLVSYTCELCSLHCYGNSHHVTEHQNIHPNNSEKNLSMFLAFNFQRINNNLKSKEFYYCEDCLTYAEVISNSDHWNKSHKTKLKRFSCQPCRTEFFCIEGNNLYNKHILSSEHIILKYVTSKNAVIESKSLPLDKSLKSNLQNYENLNCHDSKNTLDMIEKQEVPMITNSYLNWFNIIEDQNKAICTACDDQIEINDTAFLTHLLICNQNSKNYIPKINVQYFKCLECSFYCKYYSAWQKHAILHVNIDSCGLYSYFCKGCTSLLYGRMNDIELHLHNEHNKIISDMPLETVLLAKQLMRRNNNTKSSDIRFFCEPCKKIFNTVEDNNHFNTDSHISAVTSDIIELFYCDHCQVEFYSSNEVYEFHNLTVEHIILRLEVSDVNSKSSPKPSKLDTYIFQFINNQNLYDQTQNIGFFCFICDYLCFTLSIWITHTSSSHINSAKDHYIEHRCTICKTLMFGKRQHIFEHYSNRFHSILRTFNKYINVQKENDLLLKTNCGTKHVYSAKTTENNQNAAICNNLLESTNKIMSNLSVESNTQQDSSISLPGLNESISNIKETSVKLLHTYLIESNTQITCYLPNECTTNINETHSLKETDDLFLESNTENYSAFYVSRIDILKQLLNQNKEIRPQFVFYCAICDFITVIQKAWDEHNLTDHSNDIKIRHQMFCDTCYLHQFGSPESFDKHRNTIEHKNMVDFQKLYNSNNLKKVDDLINVKNKIKSNFISKIAKEKTENKNNSISAKKSCEISDVEDNLISGKKTDIFENKNNSIAVKTNEKCEDTNSLISDKTSITSRREVNNSINDENEVNNRKITIEIKGVKPDYRINSWVELKRILAVYGYFRIYPKYDSAIIVFRKLFCMYEMLKDKEKLEKKHEFTISVIVEEEKLPELNKSIENEFGNKDILLKTINKLFTEINQEIVDPGVYNRLTLLMSSVHQCAGPFIGGKVYNFGSRMSGLPLKDSDVDLYFDIGDTFTGAISNDLFVQEDLVRYFGKVFRSQTNDFKQIQPITGARVPIVKFYHVPSNLNCDLSFKSGLSTHNTKLVRLYLALDRRVHWVVCAVVKRWALYNDLKNQSMFTSYALVWLVLFYLMVINVVPPLKLLRNHASPITDVMFIEDWDCTFCTQEKALQLWKVPEFPCWDLLLGFFKFYADPNRLKQFVLCPALGEVIPKDKFYNIPTDKQDVLGFYKKKTGNVQQRCLKIKNNFSGEGLALQDPFDLFHNITKTIVPRKLQSFSHLCNKTLEVMHNGIQPYYA